MWRGTRTKFRPGPQALWRVTDQLNVMVQYWLDHEANTVDEQRVIETLEAASDYECGVEGLDEPGKAIVKKLREWAGDLAKVAGEKWKRTFFGDFFFVDPTSLTYFGSFGTWEGNQST